MRPFRSLLLLAAVPLLFVWAAPGQVSAPFPTLLQGTPVMLQLDETLRSGNARMGTRVAFEVISDVRIAERVVIPAGSSALGTVTQTSHRSWTGGTGRVSVNIDAVRLPGGQVVALSTTPDLEDNGRGTADDAIATSLVAPHHAAGRLVSRRDDALIPQGTVVRAFIRRDTMVVQQTASISNR